DVFGFLGVDAQPAIVADAKLSGAFRLNFGQMVKVITEAVSRATIEAGPEGRVAQRPATTLGHALIIVGNPRGHMDVGVNVVHDAVSGAQMSTFSLLPRKTSTSLRASLL